ncbi:alpha/beta hydrolase [Streptomyces sp. NPDC048057]|uniref:alpha/beta hydrolase n=1 Tax=Streptomyces sp. NPDC048057 TaxID=3155628 RepID=UPI0033FB942A
MERTGAEGLLSPEDVDIAFYGDAFRAVPRQTRGADEPRRVADLDEGLEQDLLLALWEAAATAEPDRVAAPAAEGTRAPTPLTVQRAMNALLRSRCMPGAVAERFLLGTLRQVRRYLEDDAVRRHARNAVASRIGPDTAVVVGHSLGSVVAYEALCADPGNVRALVTLGSPLGMPKLVFDRLDPAPVDGRGAWPKGVRSWTNLCDGHDVVASVKRIGPLFDVPGGWRAVDDRVVDNGWKVHDLGRHLTDASTGQAMVSALRLTDVPSPGTR